MKFIDANVFIRYLTNDDPARARACFEFFQRLKRGEDEATIVEAILSEVVYVLSSPQLYNLSPSDIRSRLGPLLVLKGLKLREKRLYLKALDIYASHPFLDFEDALAVTHMGAAGITEILSYDRDFDRLPGIRRIEPT